MNEFLEDHTKMEFTQCFRLSKDIASELGRIWGKEIIGVNDDCKVESMSIVAAMKYIAQQEPKDIMCLGARTGNMSTVLNWLEEDYPEKFNKNTVYASIADNDRGRVAPDDTTAIFTTFDSSKGMERDICVVFDYDESYWGIRSRKAQQKYEILRNIFLVAASRGKSRIIFAYHDKPLLTEKVLSTPTKNKSKFEDTTIDGLFSFKYKEDIEKAYQYLNITKRKTNESENNDIINLKQTDGLIDLSPCINIYQQSAYFKNYNLDTALEILYIQKYLNEMPDYQRNLSIDKKILLLTSLLTNQMRYRTQVETPLVDSQGKKQLFARLSTQFDRNITVQKKAELEFVKNGKVVFNAVGLADVVQDDVAYYLRFADALTHENFLECACYMFALGVTQGTIWNIRDNTKYDIQISNYDKFINAVTNAVSKGAMKKYNN